MNTELKYVTTPRSMQGVPFFTVVETVTTSTEDVARVDHIVRHPGGCVVVPLMDDDTALCIEQYRPAVEQTILELPGGRPEIGETPRQTALRELREEIGLDAADLADMASFYPAPCFCNGLATVFLARDLTLTSAGRGEFSDHVRRVALSDVENLVSQGNLVDGKTIIGLLLARYFIKALDCCDRG